MKDKQIKFSDIIVLGFAMFAVFFGAGNLIFPPYLGKIAGSGWFLGFLCFIIADAGLAALTVLAMMKGDGTIGSVLGGLGRRAANIVGFVATLCVGPILCVPRTAATTFEMGALPLLKLGRSFLESMGVAVNLPSWMGTWFFSVIFSVIFFAIVFLLTVRPSKVVDVIGKILTPLLLLTLAILFIKGILTPIGEIGKTDLSLATTAKEGFMNGYQTMDVLGALAITMLLAKNAVDRGYETHDGKFRVMAYASIVSTIGLFLVYGGLTYIGATASKLDLGDVNQAGLVVFVTEKLLQNFGVVLLAFIVSFACLTTAIGLTSSAAEYFREVSKGRLSYTGLVAVICVFGMVICNVGITVIINIAVPILNIVYPVLLTQVILCYFMKFIKNNNVCKGAAIGALIPSCLGVAFDLGAPLEFITKLPLYEVGLSWLIPAIIGGVIGAFIRDRSRSSSPKCEAD